MNCGGGANGDSQVKGSGEVLKDNSGEKRRLRVGGGIKERRIDKYLHGRFRNYSRSSIQSAINNGMVEVNAAAVKPSFKLSSGDVIDLRLPEQPSSQIEPEDICLDIIYEDADIIVLNKQAGIIIHPARGNRHGTLVNALVHYSKELSSGVGEFRPGIVHRLDRNTTGVMVVAKNDSAQFALSKQFRERTVQKSYLAVVHGRPELDADRIKASLGVHPRVREKYAVRPENGKEAVTFYEVLEEFRGYCLLRLVLKTGRTHQIRVHLSHIKHPVAGDDMYGGKVVYPWQLRDDAPALEEPVLNRPALHSHILGFRHPGSGELVSFEAPPAQDMERFLDMLRRYRGTGGSL